MISVVLIIVTLIPLSLSSCGPNCSTCKFYTLPFRSQCAECVQGYVLNGSECVIPIDCYVLHCNSCSSTNYCSLCFSPYVAVEGICKICYDDYCDQCYPYPNICTKCKPNYGLASDYYCYQCSDNQCEYCYNNYKQCQQCYDSYGVDQNKKCSECHQQECNICSKDYKFCTNCVSNFGPNAEGKCQKCFQEECVDCQNMYDFCLECGDGFALSGVNSGVCEPCEEDCARCSTPTYCIECILKSQYGGICSCLDMNCQQCPNSYTKCKKCINGFGVDLQNNNCVQCQPSVCSNCTQTNYLKCYSCDDGLFLNDDKQCEYCSENCLLCRDGVSCDLCLEGYYIHGVDLLCWKCPQNCTKCVWNNVTNDVMCTECVDHFHIKDNQFLCTDICGDTLRFTLPCDFKLGIEYDGCTDNCEIEQNFQCKVTNGISESDNSTVNPFNEEMVCSYDKPLDLKIESIERERFVNKLKIIISIQPKLYMFSSISFDDLFSISYLFSIDQVQHDQKKNLINLYISFNENVKDQSFNIFFTPKEQNDIRFYATPQTTVAFKVNSLNFYSDFAYGISRIIKPFCFIILTFCWINSILGLITKKLAGIQNFICCQIFFQVFLWIQCPLYMPFEGTQPLQYLSVFHISFSTPPKGRKLQLSQIISYNDNLSEGVPHIDKFGSSYSLLNNFLIPLIIEVIILLSFFIFGFIANYLDKKVKQLIENKGENFYSDQYDASQIPETKRNLEIMEKARNFSAQILLFYVTINITPFINATVFLFKYSHNAVEVEELLVLSVGAVTFLCTLFLFYFDPDPFDFYRYAFRRQWFTLPFFWFVLCALAATDVLIALLPQSSWAAVLPFGCVFLYVLICRPFKDLKENYRSAATFLVTVFVLCFRVFVQYFPQNLNNNFTYCYFLLTVLFALILCLSTTIFIIYKFIYFQYVLPTIKKYNKNAIMEEIDFMKVKEKIQKNKSPDSVFYQLISYQMSILNFSNEMRTLAFEKEIGEFAHTERKNMNLLRNDIISLNWSKEESFRSSRLLRQQMKLKSKEFAPENGIEVYNQIFEKQRENFEKKMQKIDENIKQNH